MAPSNTPWKPKTLNGSTSGSSISSASSVNRGPPPQPPPASRKPSLVTVHRTVSLLSSPVCLSYQIFSFLFKRVTRRIMCRTLGIRRACPLNRRL
jgi:hypothetical protein